jgi:hypothetical protein
VTTEDTTGARYQQLQASVTLLARARRRLETLNDLIAADEQRYRESRAYDYAQQQALKEIVATTEEKVRLQALETFELTGDTTPAPDITVYETVAYDYSHDAAITWAMDQKLSGLVSLRKGEFEKLCNTAARPPFVLPRHVHQTRIARDLSDWLPDETPAGADSGTVEGS